MDGRESSLQLVDLGTHSSIVDLAPPLIACFTTPFSLGLVC